MEVIRWTVLMLAVGAWLLPRSGECSAISDLYARDQVTRSQFKDGDSYNREDEAHEDAKRRAILFEVIAARLSLNPEELIQTATVLQHTNIDWAEEGNESAKSQDNHILAYFLARRAFVEGHKDGGWLMSAAISRWLRISGLPIELGITASKSGGQNVVVLLAPDISDEQRMKAGLPFELGRSLPGRIPTK